MPVLKNVEHFIVVSQISYLSTTGSHKMVNQCINGKLLQTTRKLPCQSRGKSQTGKLSQSKHTPPPPLSLQQAPSQRLLYYLCISNSLYLPWPTNQPDMPRRLRPSLFVCVTFPLDEWIPLFQQTVGRYLGFSMPVQPSRNDNENRYLQVPDNVCAGNYSKWPYRG